MNMKAQYDVAVIGGGNAALCAALEARRAGASVLVLEAAPATFRGGNSRHTRNVRYMHHGPDHYLVGTYDEDEFFKDLLQVTGGETNEPLARVLIRASEDLGSWMAGNGVVWQPPLKGTLQLSRTNAFFLGGGKALLNAYYETAASLGIECAYEAEVRELERTGDNWTLEVSTPEGSRRVQARAIVAACGGFEANVEWLAEYWGEAAQNFAIRGTPYNKGRLIRVLHALGAQPVGNPREYHAIAVDARGPRFDGGIVTRLDSVPIGIVVNCHGQRFSDEGADFWPKRYASWGGLIVKQPGQVVFSIVDSKMMGEFMPSLYPPVRADSIQALALEFDLDPEALDATVSEYNSAVVPGTHDLTKLDDCHTEGLDPPKSHWALPIDTPPFFGYPLRPGITFTYFGVSVNERAQVLDASGQPMLGIHAAGEIMSGNILGRGYLAGFGMTIGSVYGRIAGREAAAYALG
jgi:tricarballylate dehydrogenase